MADHICNHEGDIAELKAAMMRLDKDVNGNGKLGLRDNVTTLIQQTKELKDSNKELKDSNNDLKTAVSGFLKFQTEIKASERNKDKSFVRWIAIITIGLTIFNIIITQLA